MIDVIIIDSFFAQWDVDGRYYLWNVYETEDGEQFVERMAV